MLMLINYQKDIITIGCIILYIGEPKVPKVKKSFDEVIILVMNDSLNQMLQILFFAHLGVNQNNDQNSCTS